MIFTSACRALQRLFTSQYRVIMLKEIGLTFAIIAVVLLLIRQVFMHYFGPLFAYFFPELSEWTLWSQLGVLVIFKPGFILPMAFLVSLTAAIIGSFFVDSAAEVIEKEDYPGEPIGQAMPFERSFVLSLKFAMLSLFCNGIAFIIAYIISFFVPGINFITFYAVNGYLLGHEYFVLSARRSQSKQEAAALLYAHRMTIFGAGLLIVFFASIPVLNLATPLFAAAFMTYLRKMLSHSASTSATSNVR
ncbi:CysZ-like protein [Bartonella australis AUST/NH1]|uniref:CysZ-like protein n=1 Tax=Bartonella australis (strain Aust/NH1) TaxID=1094489 RepID=M1P283_BARAA|nr:sulfate transporter family protein [Bartonella australis]AGF73925.1 CysZ-like protein [Bartonella australis AUST/NH1]